MARLTRLLVLAALALVRADHSINYVVERLEERTEAYRLPDTEFDPIHCEIEITPYFDDAPQGKEEFTFDGRAVWHLKTLGENLNSITLHDNLKNITSVKITDTNETVVLQETVPFERLVQYQFLKITSDLLFTKDQEFKVHIDYVGNINETPLRRGMFRGYYKDENNVKRWYAATHLQPTHSRQLFPSFDEPGFKSTFDIIVNRPAYFSETFSNMKLRPVTTPEALKTTGDRVREVFQTTPRMSSYLISIHISDGFKVIADNNQTDKSYRIIARPTAEKQGEYALEIGLPLTDWFSKYLGVEYYTMKTDMKNDQLASPYWASGATENWGLVTYRELRLLYEEGETNALDKMYIGTITAHELAHKWFGNYITCRWWDNVWINEGFASYFEYFAMDRYDRTLELEDQFNIMYLQSALSADSGTTTRALQHAVNTPDEVTGHFSGISYSKGASLLLMLKHFVTEETFKKALNSFLVDRALQHAVPDDLYKAFELATEEDGTLPENVDIKDFMKTWVEEQGYPVLTVDVNMGTGLMKLKQERFYISPSGTPTEQVWPLPLTFTAGRSPDWENLTVSHVLLTEEGEIQKAAGHEYVIFNVQQKGIYRVNYDTHNWEMIARALNNNHSNIHHLNRAQIVDDVFAFMRSERMTFELGFEVLNFLKKDTSYYSWYPAISGFNWIRNRFLHLPDELAQFDEILLEFLDAVIKDVGYNVVTDEPLTKTLNRFFVLTFACNIGHEGCVNDAVAKFKALKDDQTPVNPNLRRHVFCTGLREGGYDEWRFLFDRKMSSNNQADELAMLRALGCTSDDNAITELLEHILSEDVKAQDRLNALTWLLSASQSNAQKVLDFLKKDNNIARVQQAVVLNSWYQSVLSNLAASLDDNGLKDMESWLTNNQQDIPESAVGLSAIGNARTNMEWGTKRAKDILSALRDSVAALIPTTTLLVSALLALMLK